MKARIVVFLIACMSLSLIGGLMVRAQVQDKQDVQLQEKAKQQARKHFMRGKLESNKKIVEGLSLKDFAMIREGAKGVTAIVKGQHWFVLDTPAYKDYSQDMEQAAKRLVAAADKKNLEAATLRYFELTLNCIDCHRYLETQSW